MSKQGLFVGLVTLDFVYLTENFPGSNDKVVASDCCISAGGPATNAAVTFSYLGNGAMLLGAVGKHPVTELVRADLNSCNVVLTDLDANRFESPPVSSIIVTQSTGDRAVISINATRSQVGVDNFLDISLQAFDVVLIDGHQMPVGEKIARLARCNNIPVVLDGGSWKPGFESVLPWVDYAICSANFSPPGCYGERQVVDFLRGFGIAHIAISQGENPIKYWCDNSWGEVPVPSVVPVDTLGCGDVLHGAFCHYILEQDFVGALMSAAKIASFSCQYFGTRRWMGEAVDI